MASMKVSEGATECSKARTSKKVREGKQNVVRVVSKVVGARQYSKARK